MGRIFSDQEIVRNMNEFMNDILTPSEDEQILRILKGLCPHNKGWIYVGFNDCDDAFGCKICNEIIYR
jgi:hypothetical protein